MRRTAGLVRIDRLGNPFLSRPERHRLQKHPDQAELQEEDRQADLIDLLPAELDLVRARSNSGRVSVDGTTVQWNGAIRLGRPVTVTLEAAIRGGTVGLIVSNQPAIRFDADGRRLQRVGRGDR